MVVIDATMLMLILRPDSIVPSELNGKPIDRVKERVDFLVSRLEKAKEKLVIPTPALSEVLVRAGIEGSQKVIEEIGKHAVFRVEPFDERAAIEVAAMTRNALARGKKKGNSNATWAKIKYDRQIVAIAAVNRATTIYSDDGDIRSIAKDAGITVVGLADLPLPPQDPQHPLPFPESGRRDDGEGNTHSKDGPPGAPL